MKNHDIFQKLKSTYPFFCQKLEKQLNHGVRIPKNGSIFQQNFLKLKKIMLFSSKNSKKITKNH